MTEQRTWAYWEDWEHGWELIGGHLHFEGEDVDRLLPPHLLPMFDLRVPTTHVPTGPAFHPDNEPRNWVLEFPFENGWSGMVGAEYGVALNGAVVHGINRRLVPLTMDNAMRLGPWPDPSVWDDPGLAWQEVEMEAIGLSYPFLDDPDHLIECLTAIAVLPSDPDVRRKELE